MTDPRYQLLKDFIAEWPYERIQRMTLQEYTNRNRSSFCYWLEAKSNDLGSIWGGSSFKFGIYEKDQKHKTYNTRGRLSDDEYAWYAKYGKTRDEAFDKVKSLLIEVLDAVNEKNYSVIDRIDVGDTVKWKLAFIYSDFQILNIFSKLKLVNICKDLKLPLTKNDSFFELQDRILKTKPTHQDYFIFGDQFWRNIEPSLEPFPSNLDIMNYPLNQILFGPPGTGKTYNSIDRAVNIATGQSRAHAENKIEFDRLRKEGRIEFVTFHQGYSYEDFMVGIKPNIDTEQLTFKPHKGIFYRLVELAKANYIAHKDQKQELRSFDAVFEELIAPLEDGQTVEIMMKGGNPFTITDVNNGTIRFDKPKGYGGHTLSVDTLKAIVDGKREFNSGLGSYYKPLVKLIHERQRPIAAPTSLKNFVIIIDEINRANISKVFGELITLLEDDKRMGKENALSLTLPNGEPDFSIPPNVYIIGTMNTADKSIALVDIALRRRFEFEGCYPDYETLSTFNDTYSMILQKINETIYTRKKTADFLIGHGYFMKKDESLDTILLKKVIPLLMEYFSGRTEEVKEILKAANINAEYSTLNYRWHINPTTFDEIYN